MLLLCLILYPLCLSVLKCFAFHINKGFCLCAFLMYFHVWCPNFLGKKTTVKSHLAWCQVCLLLYIPAAHRHYCVTSVRQTRQCESSSERPYCVLLRVKMQGDRVQATHSKRNQDKQVCFLRNSVVWLNFQSSKNTDLPDKSKHEQN